MSILNFSHNDSRHFSSELAQALGDVNAAVIVQQLHYWIQLKKDVGVVIDGVRWIYNSFQKWVEEQFKWLTSWQFRQSMKLLRDLGIVKVIRYRAKKYDQTNYYTLDYDRLIEFVRQEIAESIETVEMCVTSDRDVTIPPIEMRKSHNSYKGTETTSLEETTKQFAVAPTKNGLKEEENPSKGIYLADKIEPLKPDLNTNPVEIINCTEEEKSSPPCSTNEVQETAKLDKNRKVLLDRLEDLGLRINRTIIREIKSHSLENIENAIALIAAAKRDKYIANPEGYFVQALKENWTTSNRSTESNNTPNTKFSFDVWYELAKELGYCTLSEERDGEQWVYMSGTWEKWIDAWNRGYTVQYLKQILDRTKNR